MVRGKNINDTRVSFSYSKCDGMVQTTTVVDKKWFDEHNTETMTPEELDYLAYSKEERNLSNATGQTMWWGLD